MADYIYLLENRLSPAQRDAVRVVAELVRSKGLTVFLVGGAVRDLTTGSPVRDLDLVVQGSALKLRKDLERAGATISGEYEPMQSLYLRFANGIRMELGSTLTVTYPKPGKPVARPAGIQEDLRRRDFTANAMALSLNEGSYGLLMDPLNGVADIENRELRLISNYGFVEEPVRMIRAARLMARLGWQMEERTAARYRTGVEENYIATLSEFHRGYETEEIFHEEDPLRVLERMDAEGWMAHLAPFLTPAKVNVPELERLREVQTRLQMQGIQPDNAAASFPLLTAKLNPQEIATLKASFPRKGFVAEIDELDGHAKQLTAQLTGKQTARPSETWKLLHQSPPEVVLAVAFGARGAAVQAKFKSFETEWPQARQRIPYQLMQEMRIVPELPGYAELVEKLFFELMDDTLPTPEAMRAYLEPYSPPAPPPPVSLRKARVGKKEAKAPKSRSKKVAEETEELAADEPETTTAKPDAPVAAPVPPPAPAPVKPAAKAAVAAAPPHDTPAAAPVKAPPAKTAPVKTAAVSAKAVPAKAAPAKAAAAKQVAKAPAKAPPAKPAPGKSAPVKTKGKATPAKAVPVKTVQPSKKTAAPAKAAKPVKAVSRPAPAPPQKTAAAVKGKPAPVKIAAKAPAKANTPAKKAAPKKAATKAPAKATPAARPIKTANKAAAKRPVSIPQKSSRKR